MVAYTKSQIDLTITPLCDVRRDIKIERNHAESIRDRRQHVDMEHVRKNRRFSASCHGELQYS